ncbi:unnamed protein product [Didymodactylos carnosus]|uniref:Uncharacterized protein n=1 Tax=Didymodactylos carnosus TaxID=1234261 RepID=A0A814N3Q3_9BILA|nr:unnamed protein product [Didymodactylos carnosus]CAF3853441.1 unnamed protein product [Didymodactylos carnosus]
MRALENYRKAFEMYARSLPPYHPDITKMENSIERLSPNDGTAAKSDDSQEKPAESAAANDTDNIETFTIVWLDANVNTTEDNTETYHALRTIVNYIRTYDAVQPCEEYVTRVSRASLILIVSGGFGREIVPRIHDLEQVNSVYVYCADKKRNERWAKDYAKVRSVIVERAELIEKVSDDQKIRALMEDAAVPVSILSRTAITTARRSSAAHAKH